MSYNHVATGLVVAATAALVVAALAVGSPAGVGAEEAPQPDSEETAEQPDEQAVDQREERDAGDELEQMHRDDGVKVIYQGVLQNEQGDPVSGVLPLTFHLYRGEASAEPMWSEDHYVSVIDGRYQVPLGGPRSSARTSADR